MLSQKQFHRLKRSLSILVMQREITDYIQFSHFYRFVQSKHPVNLSDPVWVLLIKSDRYV